MTGLPLVSIVVPVYNAGPFISETLDSLLAQSYSALDIIVIDDGSTDDTPARLKSYSDRVRLCRHDNRGEAETVNRGSAEARGEFIAIVNADDPVQPHLIAQAMNRFAQDPGLAALYPDWNRIDRHGVVLDTVRAQDFDISLMLAQHLCIPGPGAIVRRTALGTALLRDPVAGYSADFDFWLRFGLSHRVARLPEVLASWRFHAAGASQAAANSKLAADKIGVIERFLARSDLPLEIRALSSQAKSAAYFKAAIVGMRGRGVPVRRYLAYSFALKPLWPRGVLRSERRSPLHVFYLCLLPISRWLLYVIAPLLPAGARRKADALLRPQ